MPLADLHPGDGPRGMLHRKHCHPVVGRRVALVDGGESGALLADSAASAQRGLDVRPHLAGQPYVVRACEDGYVRAGEPQLVCLLTQCLAGYGARAAGPQVVPAM